MTWWNSSVVHWALDTEENRAGQITSESTLRGPRRNRGGLPEHFKALLKRGKETRLSSWCRTVGTTSSSNSSCQNSTCEAAEFRLRYGGRTSRQSLVVAATRGRAATCAPKSSVSPRSNNSPPSKPANPAYPFRNFPTIFPED